MGYIRNILSSIWMDFYEIITYCCNNIIDNNINEKKEYKQLGAYGLVVKDGRILLIKKFGGPYDGKLDLPGGTIEFCERPLEALKRELMEEVGIEVNEYQLFDADSVSFKWQFKEDVIVKVHHTGNFFKVYNFKNIKNTVQVDKVNDDSLGADFYKNMI